MSELLSNYVPTRTLRSGSRELLQESKSSHTWGDRSFAIAAPRLWNELPLNIRNANNVDTFKKLLKTRMMSKTYC